MYVEKNGFVIMQKQDMSFLAGQGIADEEFWFDDDINEAIIFDSISEAKETLEELPLDKYEILTYEKTIFLTATENNEKASNHCECDTDSCKCSGHVDLSNDNGFYHDGWGNDFQIKYKGSE